MCKHWSFKFVSICFTYFFVDILWTYIKVPTTTLGAHLFYATKPTIIDGQVQPGVEVIDAKCLPPYRLCELQDQSLWNIGSQARRNIVRLAREAGLFVAPEEEEELANKPVFASGNMEAEPSSPY
jgi:hypothetical protein